MTDLFDEPHDATPLAPEEKQGLLQTHITFRWELNEAEQQNIYRAQDWALATRRDLLTDKFIKDLHRRMLGDVWRWAGKFRTSERNLGIKHYEVAPAVRLLLDDTKALDRARVIRIRRDRPCASIIGWCRYIRSRMAMAGMRD